MPKVPPQLARALASRQFQRLLIVHKYIHIYIHVNICMYICLHKHVKGVASTSRLLKMINLFFRL